MSLTPEAIKSLSRVSTATITTVLLKKGLRNVWIAGRASRLRPDSRGWWGRPLRCVSYPRREDLADAGIMVVADFDPDRDRSHA